MTTDAALSLALASRISRERLPWLVAQQRAAYDHETARLERVRQQNRDAKARLYAKRDAAGLCRRCGSSERPANRVHCPRCQARETARRRAIVSADREGHRRYLRAKRRRLIREGLCTQCRKPVEAERRGSWMCGACARRDQRSRKSAPAYRAKERARMNAKRAGRVAAGVCVRCETPQVRERIGRHYCEACTIAAREGNARSARKRRAEKREARKGAA